MQIVLEGPDNSGKSTLAKFIAEQLMLPIVHSGGPEKYPGELISRVHNRLSIVQPTIHDRHPCISQGIYLNALCLDGTHVPDDMVKAFYESKPLIIYCRNAGTLDGHVMSEHATSDYHKRVEQGFNVLCDLYDDWALRHANVTYRIGDDMNAVVRMVRSYMNDDVLRLADAVKEMYRFDPVKDVDEFHSHFKIAYKGLPRLLPPSLREFRENFLYEEVREYSNAKYGNSVQDRLEKMLDALVDVVYVALGTSHLHGFNFREAWRRVHTANMMKVRAEVGKVGPRGDAKYDVIKPDGWRPPVLNDLVRNNIHEFEADVG